jgi:hypothetical protein
MGSVYEARHTSLGKLVAIEVMAAVAMPRASIALASLLLCTCGWTSRAHGQTACDAGAPPTAALWSAVPWPSARASWSSRLRFVRRRLVLAHLVDGALETARDLVVSESVQAGPVRAEVFSATRTLVLDRRAARPTDRLGVHTLIEGRRRRCRTRLVFEGRTFVPRNPTCAAR